MSDVKQLHDLQKLDLEIGDVESALKMTIARLADGSELSVAGGRVEELQAGLDDLASRRRVMERTVSQYQEDIERLNGRLYGGAVTNPQQLEAASEERSYTLERQSESEDQLLGIMVAIEDAEPVLAEARTTLSTLEAERPGEVAEWRREEARLRERLDLLGRTRQDAVPLIAANVLPLYESLRKSKGGRAVAVVKRGMCQGCRLALPTMELQRARGASGIVQCSSCGRILYAE